MKAIRLRTEYLNCPMGIDMMHPRLMWNCEGGVRQAAYQVIAETDNQTVWDSKKMESASMRCVFPGELQSRQRVTWRVRLWNENDKPGEWTESGFEMGLLKPADWQARWITGSYTVDKKKRYPVDCFRRAFSCEKKIEKARLYITACGLYAAGLNGQRIGNFVLAPGHTDYRKRVQYQTIDVTEFLQGGENEITVWLADGWYRGSCGAWGRKNQYGVETKLLAQMEITYIDHSVQIICTDSSWQWSDDGPIRFADNKDGEIVEAFRVPMYSGRAKETRHTVVPAASDNVPVTEHERFHPAMAAAPNGKVLLDFGQNIAGYVAFRVQAREGQRMVWRFGELLDEDGNLTQKNIQCSNKKITTPLQKIEYICKEGLNTYKTTFAVFGFRYAEVGTDVKLSEGEVEAVAVYSDMEETGFFESSNQLLNQFVEATKWSAKSNSLDVPTDCPTRERHGWSGDAQIFCSTACFLFDYMPFGTKYLNDLYDWQKPNGKLPQIAPEGGTDSYMKFMDGSVGWADAGVIIPYVLWKQYGDPEIIRRFLPGMRKYAAFMQNRCGKWYPTAKRTGLKGVEKRYLSNYGQAYGEWAEPDEVHHMTWKDCAVPHPEVATAYTAYIMDCMAEIEDALGNTKEAEEYRSFAAGCRTSYQALVKTKDFSLDTDRQAQLVRPLYMNLLDAQQTAFARKRLLGALEHYGWRIGTGFLSTPLILDVLTGIDIESAYRLLENEEIPGWLSMPKNGATTIWEGWEGPKSQNGIASLNHYSKGAMVGWLFKTMCGIRVDGENHFTIAPRPGGHFTHASAEYQSVYGKVESGWERTESGTVYTMSVPVNCTAEVSLPSGRKQELAAGKYTFEEAMA